MTMCNQSPHHNMHFLFCVRVLYFLQVVSSFVFFRMQCDIRKRLFSLFNGSFVIYWMLAIPMYRGPWMLAIYNV